MHKRELGSAQHVVPAAVSTSHSAGSKFIDTGELAERFVEAVGLGTYKLRFLMIELAAGVRAAGTLEIAGAIADTTGMKVWKAKRLIKVLLEVHGHA